MTEIDTSTESVRRWQKCILENNYDAQDIIDLLSALASERDAAEGDA